MHRWLKPEDSTLKAITVVFWETRHLLEFTAREIMLQQQNFQGAM